MQQKSTLNFLLLCDYAVLGKEEKISAIGIFQRISPKQYPYTHSKFFVVFNTSINSKGSHQLSIALNKKKDGKEIQKIVFSPFEVTQKDYVAQAIGEFSQTMFEGHGEYSLNVFLDNKPLGSREIVLNDPLKK